MKLNRLRQWLYGQIGELRGHLLHLQWWIEPEVTYRPGGPPLTYKGLTEALEPSESQIAEMKKALEEDDPAWKLVGQAKTRVPDPVNTDPCI